MSKNRGLPLGLKSLCLFSAAVGALSKDAAQRPADTEACQELLALPKH
jgi:hypothetical protein